MAKLSKLSKEIDIQQMKRWMKLTPHQKLKWLSEVQKFFHRFAVKSK